MIAVSARGGFYAFAASDLGLHCLPMFFLWDNKH